MAPEAPSAPTCPWCSATSVKKDGRDTPLSQRFRCRSCHQTFTDRTGTPFAGHRWPLEVITTAVRWYSRYRLSAANVRDLLAERNLDVSSRTVVNWVQ
jgi:putative transposase